MGVLHAEAVGETPKDDGWDNDTCEEDEPDLTDYTLMKASLSSN